MSSDKKWNSLPFPGSKHDYQRLEEPYVGPRPFRRNTEDQLRFFGRDAEIDEIVALISSHQNVLIYAQSGAGKTSIFNAGVAPSLENDGFDVLPMARVQVASSHNFPVHSNKSSLQIENIYIYNALLSLRPEIDPQSILHSYLFEFLDKYFPTRRDERGEMRAQVLIFDQLEELFNYYLDNWIEQQKGFFEQIADSLDNNPHLRIVLVIREDFLAQLDPFRTIFSDRLRTRFRLERLRKKEAFLAIKGPLTNAIDSLSEVNEMQNIESEINALVSDLVKMYAEDTEGGGGIRQLEGEFIEPIQLQVVCRRWWQQRNKTSKGPGQDKKTTTTTGVSSGISLEATSSVDSALQNFYEDAIFSASKQTGVPEGKIRTWCQEKLITSSGTRSVAHRGEKTTEGIDNNVIDWLERKYLIRKERRSGASWYELTHDRLVKPMTTSNEKWKNANDRKKNRKAILAVGLTATIIIIALSAILGPPYLVSVSQINEPIVSGINQTIVPVGEFPISVAVNPNTNMVYVANYLSGRVSVIDGTANSLVRDVPVGEFPINSVAVNPNTNMVYVANSNSSTVSVIDGTTGRAENIAVGSGPTDIAVSPRFANGTNSDTIYVTNSHENTLSIIDITIQR
jgi:YVTN family beta-propeller protein